MFTLLEHHVSYRYCAYPFIHNLNLFFFSVIISGPAYEMMKKCGLHEESDGSFNFFPTVHDAVHQAMDNLAPISVITDTS